MSDLGGIPREAALLGKLLAVPFKLLFIFAILYSIVVYLKDFVRWLFFRKWRK